MLTLTVDMLTTPHTEIAKVARFMLAFVGDVDVALPVIVPPAAKVPPPPPPPPPRAPVGAPGIDVDSYGIPWDARIHAASRAKVASGAWRLKRQLDTDTVLSVESELRRTMGLGDAGSDYVEPDPQDTNVEAIEDYVALVEPEQAFRPRPVPHEDTVQAPPPPPFVASVVPPVPRAITIPSAPASAGAVTTASPFEAPAMTFPMFVSRVTAAFHGKTLTQADIQRAVASVGLSGMPMLASRPDLIAAVATELGLPS